MPRSDSARRIGRGLRELLAAPARMLVRHLPGPLGIRLRRVYWRRRLGALGEDVRIDEGVQIVNPQHVFIGPRCWIATGAFIGAGPPSTDERELFRRPNPDFTGDEGQVRIGPDCYLGPRSLINGHGGVEIGENVSVSAAAHIFSASHHYRSADGRPGEPAVAAGQRRGPSADIGRQVLALSPVVIRPESFIGAHAVVLNGVSIGPATWLGAGAVARRSLEPGRLYVAPDPEPVDLG